MQSTLLRITLRRFRSVCSARLVRNYATLGSQPGHRGPPSFQWARKPNQAPDESRKAPDEPRKTPQVTLQEHLNLVPQTVQPDDVLPTLSRLSARWSIYPPVSTRIRHFGVPGNHVADALSEFAEGIVEGTALNSDDHTPAELARIARDLSQPNNAHAVDHALTTAFLSWFAHHSTAPEKIKLRIRNLSTALDFRHPAELFPMARRIRRKVIMHVGPTNSGKTHNALRALAAAPRGAYAGPLRLLAHEIHERLCTGQIIPLGVDPEQLPPAPEEDSGLDALPRDGKAIRKVGDPRFARLCGLLTGEERKFDDAALMSCTIEMLTLDKPYDVLVVDEIQMLDDSERGFSWTSAVLGAAARELHLCGEEAAVPVVQALLDLTGDELIVNRYERLSPLGIAERSLEGDLKHVQKGDCVVAFSRTRIFALKREIEKATGLRCALVYGRLPPEIRSEQAALFNDPDSGYDVLVGSDAIGMGLNLKIRRVVFDALGKFDGIRERPLSNSQVKQIAGRAGRFGLHANTREPGIVTTLHEQDLPFLRTALAAPVTYLPYGRVGWFNGVFERVMSALPPDASTVHARHALIYATRLAPSIAVMEPSAREDRVLLFIDRLVRGLTFEERATIQMTPVPHSDETCRAAVEVMLRAYCTTRYVDLRRVLEEVGLLDALEDVLAAMRADRPLGQVSAPLKGLESLHKVVLAYMWLHIQLPIAFFAYGHAAVLKRSTEAAMEWLLKKGGERKKVGMKKYPRAGAFAYHKSRDGPSRLSI